MPDIAMCKGEGCPLKEKCYRHTAKPSECLQSYFVTPPYKDDKCEYFWDNERRGSIRKKEANLGKDT